ncbi:MAG: ATP-dependent DNA helicase UvrD2, partial [Ilumatobacter sp.]|nr:ATP-dependent DNA helicase UvrD2 [Ilumatobacter sp.]
VVPFRRGPVELGRSVIVGPGQPAPAAWADVERIIIDAAAVERPAATIAALRAAAAERAARVVELHVDATVDQAGVDDREPYEAGVGAGFADEELAHLVRSNAIDVRDGDRPLWPLVDEALALGATIAGDGPGDVVDPAGVACWLDGGPVRFTPRVDDVEVVHSVQLEHGRFDRAVSNTPVAELADDQLAAVAHDGGSARIIAPAGSGKTRVLTERARHVLTNWRLPPTAVVLVAFNKRAQEEMTARTTDLPGLHIRTLNSLALAIVNGTPPFASQPRQWRTIDEPDVRRILGDLVQVPRKLNVDPIAPWIDALSLVRLGLVEPGEAEVRYGGDVDGLTDVFPQYRAALERRGLVDFDDQVYRAISTLLASPDVRRVAQRACRVMLVDEFQDLTPAHLLLIRLLAAPGGAVFGVGDDDQTIYGYNGADPAWLIDFATWFPGSASHPLEVNYRCPAGVVEIADRLLRHNRRRVAKTIRADSTIAPGWSVDTTDDPVAATVLAVQAAIQAGAKPGEIAVLTRVNATLAPVQVALTAAGVGVRGGVGREFVERTAVRAALAWLRLAGSEGSFSSADLHEALRRPSRGLSPRVREWAAEQRDHAGLERLAARLNNDRDTGKVTDFVVELSELAGAVRRGGSTYDVLDLLVDRIGLGGAVATLDRGRQGMNRSAQGDDLMALRQLARLQPGPPDRFGHWLAEQLAAPRRPDGVTLSTVHRVKGQEWPHVVAHLVADDQYPHRLADDHEEERRLLHVAITRGSHHVTVVTGEHPSPFVAELTTEPPATLPAEPERPRTALSAPSKRGSPPDHPLLERGSVMAVAGLVLVDQGHEWTVTALEPEAAVAERDGVVRRFRLDAKVETAGRQRGRLVPRSGDVDEAAVRVFDQLRTYRDQVRNGKPAYTVFDDKTLVAIATALPADASELARVKGVGPAKLDRYGDDVLDIVAAARAGT